MPRSSHEQHLLKHLLPRMVRRETAVIGRMPILRGDHERERRLKLVGDGDDRVALRHSQCAAGEEVVLKINQEETVHEFGS